MSTAKHAAGSPAKRRKRPREKARPLDLPPIRYRAAGIDAGSREHWACRPVRDGGAVHVQAFGSATCERERLADWLQAEGVETAAMESTHVYWIPLHELLEGRGIEVALVDPRQLARMTGRKTDARDCQWLQALHCRGLLRGSFRPHEGITRLRALHRQKAHLEQERS